MIREACLLVEAAMSKQVLRDVSVGLAPEHFDPNDLLEDAGEK